MSQYKTGTVTVTNNSNTIIGLNTSFLENVSVGNTFKVASDNAIYQIISVDSPTQIKISPNYAGSSIAGAAYQITTDFSPNLGLAEISIGDVDWPYHLTQEVIRKLDRLIYPVGCVYECINTTPPIAGTWVSLGTYSFGGATITRYKRTA